MRVTLCEHVIRRTRRAVKDGPRVLRLEKTMKRTALAVALISTALLSGCIIVPHRHGGGYRGGYYEGHDHGRGGYDYRYEQPGRGPR